MTTLAASPGVGAYSDTLIKRFELRGAAKEVLTCRAPEVLLAGPAGTGKSYAALLKIHLMAMLNPGSRYLIVRKTARSLAATGLVTFREQVAAEAVKQKICHWYGGSAEKPAQYNYSNGSVIVVGGMDNPDKVMSAEYDAVFVQEATELTPDDWEKITTRLRNGRVSFQQLIADCNPQQPSHWLKRRCDDGKTVMLHARHEDNPRLFTSPDADGVQHLTEYGKVYIGRLDNLTGVRKERLRHGRWAAAEGLIYEGWQPGIHLSDRKRLSMEWPRYWTVDFGFTNPFVWQMWAVDPDGRLWLEKEIYRSQRLVEDHAKDIMRTVMTVPGYANWERRGFKGAQANVGDEWKYPVPRSIICDHDAEDRATLERHLEMGTVAAHKSVSDGIQAMQVRLKVAADSHPRMRVCRDSLVERDEALAEAGKPVSFTQEIEGYVWQPDMDGKPSKDQPLKLNDHAMDAARYMVAELDLAARPNIRWL